MSSQATIPTLMPAETFAASHAEAQFLPGPIEHIAAREFLGAAGLKKRELDCLVGGPPCQAFSVYNHQRGMHDKRSGLFYEYLRIVEGLMPKWVVMENVTVITSAGDGQAVDRIHSGLANLGYRVETRILRAEEYGVPQERRRIIFLGNRLGLPIRWPEPIHGPNLKPFVNVWDAIGDLPPLSNGEKPAHPLPYRTAPTSAYQAYLRGNLTRVTNHAAPRLAPINLERMKFIPAGGSWRDVPYGLLPAGMKRARRCDHTKRYGRLRKDGLSSTILTKCDLHWGAYIHPEQDRVLTVREAARLQSFPDWFPVCRAAHRAICTGWQRRPPASGETARAGAHQGSVPRATAPQRPLDGRARRKTPPPWRCETSDRGPL